MPTHTNRWRSPAGRRPFHTFALAAALALLLETVIATEDGTIGPGEPIRSDLELTDLRGERHALSELSNGTVCVLFFFDTSCAAVREVLPHVERFWEDVRREPVTVVGVNANHEESSVTVAQHAMDVGLTFPVHRDHHLDVTRALGVARTSAVVVLDFEGVLRYRGAPIERSADGKGVAFRLEEAVHALLEGSSIDEADVPAAGCLIRARRPLHRGAVTYEENVSEILSTHCADCHRSDGAAPFALERYEDARPHAAAIARALETFRMPPVSVARSEGVLAGPSPLRRKEIEIVRLRAFADAPRGDPASASKNARPEDLASPPDRLVTPDTPVGVPVELWSVLLVGTPFEREQLVGRGGEVER